MRQKRGNKPTKRVAEHAEMFQLLSSVVDKLDTLSSSISEVDKKLDLHIQKTDFRFSNIELLDSEQNKLLAQHAQRSEEIKRDNELREAEMKKRIEALEVPHKWLQGSRALILWLAWIAAAVTSLLNFLSK